MTAASTHEPPTGAANLRVFLGLFGTQLGQRGRARIVPDGGFFSAGSIVGRTNLTRKSSIRQNILTGGRHGHLVWDRRAALGEGSRLVAKGRPTESTSPLRIWNSEVQLTYLRSEWAESLVDDSSADRVGVECVRVAMETRAVASERVGIVAVLEPPRLVQQRLALGRQASPLFA